MQGIGGVGKNVPQCAKAVCKAAAKTYPKVFPRIFGVCLVNGDLPGVNNKRLTCAHAILTARTFKRARAGFYKMYKKVISHARSKAVAGRAALLAEVLGAKLAIPTVCYKNVFGSYHNAPPPMYIVTF
jgi:hypothetical protein